MFKHKIRFCKHDELYIEDGDFVVLVENPFGKEIPEGVDEIVKIGDKTYVKGYEPTRKKPRYGD